MKTQNLLLALAAIFCLSATDSFAQEVETIDGKLGYTSKSNEILEEYQTLRISVDSN